jgi:hypothetical protein
MLDVSGDAPRPADRWGASLTELSALCGNCPCYRYPEEVTSDYVARRGWTIAIGIKELGSGASVWPVFKCSPVMTVL